ncbi:F5/8 type C domain protein [Rubripirellula obstinata]|uniref:F5/8 type C domain protein n=1 Tax=Rubripirellula obstinata TaxID=406547 RepID=A0A5B1CJM6_9BACT|nr:glycosyl hydrolase [Rubripirellula obstinata]KAA1259919.1 F5/8 type C domain protein [Rubripirellula obstinata]
MRTHLKSLLALLILSATATADDSAVKSDFVNPPLKYATRPLWFWADAPVTVEGVREQMQQARDQSGYGGFGILPFNRSKDGEFQPEYLSEEYFQVYEAALEKAKELGMTMCLYDEFGFPSGSAGGRHGDGVARFKNKYPNHTIKRLDKTEETVTGPANHTSAVPDQGRLMAIVAMEVSSKKRINLTSRVNDGSLSVNVPEGTWKIMTFRCVKTNNALCDYLDPQACQLFVDMTHQQYYDRFKQYFGTTIDGAFFDEPTIYHEGGRVWTNAFNEKFIAKHDFDPAPYYPALWYDIGEETEAARAYLFGFRAELYATGFPKVVQDWCTDHGITATGHQDQEEVVNQTAISGDLMLSFKHQDIPGVDKIGGRAAERVYKVISSAAYNWDKALVMSETYGAMGDISFTRLYQVAMDQYTKGINQLIPHAVWYDDDKVAFKPELSWRHPKYVDGLKQYNQYMGRLNVLLQNHGRHVADIAVLYPIATMQGEHQMDGPLRDYHGGVEIPELDYVDIGELLATKIGRDYTFLHPEALSERCTVQGDTLKMANRVNFENYKVMIIPGHTTIGWANLKKIKDFYDQGGKVIATGTLPSKSAEFGHDNDVVATIQTMFPEAPLGKAKSPFASSSAWPGYGSELAFDGSMETRWNAKNGTFGDQWLEVSFKDEVAVNQIQIAELFNRTQSYRIQYHDSGQWVDWAGGTRLGNKTHKLEKVITSKVRGCFDTVKGGSVSIAEFSVTLDGEAPAGSVAKPTIASTNDNGGTAVYLERPTAESLRENLDKMVDAYDVEFEVGKELRYIHKVYDGKEIYFFANLNKRPVHSWVQLRGTLEPQRWNPHTGEIDSAEFSHGKNGTEPITKVKIILKPNESIFLIGR